MKARALVSLLVLLSGLLQTSAQADTFQLDIAVDKTTGYNRSSFKHWIDADKNGCNTRAEVLKEEAVVKPKMGAKCILTGGKWLSSYDGKTITNASLLDVDHLVPLAEAWRSGAWNWTSQKRQAYANDLEDSRALIAVTLSTNRSKGDKDPAKWMPLIGQCNYVSNWIAIKWRYDLTVDVAEANILKSFVTTCRITNAFIGEATSTPTPVSTPTPETSTSTNTSAVTPGAYCAPAGATGVSKTGVSYTCKTSSTDTRNRWRQ